MRKSHPTRPPFAFALATLAFGPGCSSPEGAPVKEEVRELTAQAGAELDADDGQQIGEVMVHETSRGVLLTAVIRKAMPGPHGLHIHEKGDCSDLAGKSMGGHLAPRGHAHALPGYDGARHLGDLGNIRIDDDGEGQMEIPVPAANLKEQDPHSLIGKAVVLHAGEDSGHAEQPAGDSGVPIACGVIKRS